MLHAEFWFLPFFSLSSAGKLLWFVNLTGLVGSWFHQVNMLKERNQTYGTIAFVNIGTDDYSPEQNNGIDYETVSHPTLWLCLVGVSVV